MSESSEPLPLRVTTAVDDADRDVLVRVAAGELDALDELYDRYKTMAYSIAYRITNDATLAEDVVQRHVAGAVTVADDSPGKAANDVVPGATPGVHALKAKGFDSSLEAEPIAPTALTRAS